MAEDTQRQVDKVQNSSGLSESELQNKVEELERQCVSFVTAKFLRDLLFN